MAGILGNELTIVIGGVLVISLNLLAYSRSAAIVVADLVAMGC